MSKVFIPDDEFIWITGELIFEDRDVGIVEVQIEDEDISSEHRGTRSISLQRFNLASLPLQNNDLSTEGVPDMCSLSYLHEASILDNLKRRFRSKLPYTYTGEICVAVNPYQWLHIYTPALREAYSKTLRHQMPPHVYATSAAAYNVGLVKRGKNQSILVSGESGAGKTETVKILMNHLASIASRGGEETIDKLLEANPLLESFGNAKTARNDNSSRFGKFSQLQFDAHFNLVGSRCITYLLEKSRVVSQSSSERNYHVLYQLLAAPKDIKCDLWLDGLTAEHFAFTREGDVDTDTIEGLSDAHRYDQTMTALHLLGVYGNLKNMLQTALAGVLYLGELIFNNVDGHADTTSLDLDSGDEMQNGEATTANDVERCCQLLGVDFAALSTSMVSRSIDVEGKMLSVPLNSEQASSGRDALAKEMYQQALFETLIWQPLITASIESKPAIKAKRGASSSKSLMGTISLLDIFGFECFQVNRFEQLCINYANEKLQQKFTSDVFKTVQEEYESEGINWMHVGFSDNAEVVDLLEGRKGIIAILNEECLIPKGSDANFLSKIKTGCSPYPTFAVPPTSRLQFTISHYAGKVAYSVSGFIDRNRDTLPEDMRQLLASSKNPLLARLFGDSEGYFGNRSMEADAMSEELLNKDRETVTAYLLLDHSGVSAANESSVLPSSKKAPARSGGRASAEDTRDVSKMKRRSSFVLAGTVTSKFKTQLAGLMDTITTTEVQYVRCIKPNPSKSSKEYDRALVVEQLRSAGMIEAVRISRAAFPNRLLYADFMGRYRCLRKESWYAKRTASDAASTSAVGKEPKGKREAKELMQSLKTTFLERSATTASRGKERSKSSAAAAPPASPVIDINKLYQFGNTKLYFSGTVLERLEGLRAQAIFTNATLLQRAYRRVVALRRFLLLKISTIHIQSTTRSWLAVRWYRRARYSILLIQSVARMVICRRIVQGVREVWACTRIQSGARMRVARKKYYKLLAAVSIINNLIWTRIHVKRYIVLRDKARRFADLSGRLGLYEEQIQEDLKARQKLEEETKLALETERQKQVEERLQREALEKQLQEARELSRQQMEQFEQQQAEAFHRRQLEHENQLKERDLQTRHQLEQQLLSATANSSSQESNAMTKASQELQELRETVAVLKAELGATRERTIKSDGDSASYLAAESCNSSVENQRLQQLLTAERTAHAATREQLRLLQASQAAQTSKGPAITPGRATAGASRWFDGNRVMAEGWVTRAAAGLSNQSAIPLWAKCYAICVESNNGDTMYYFRDMNEAASYSSGNHQECSLGQLSLPSGAHPRRIEHQSSTQGEMYLLEWVDANANKPANNVGFSSWKCGCLVRMRCCSEQEQNKWLTCKQIL